MTLLFYSFSLSCVPLILLMFWLLRYLLYFFFHTTSYHLFPQLSFLYLLSFLFLHLSCFYVSSILHYFSSTLYFYSFCTLVYAPSYCLLLVNFSLMSSLRCHFFLLSNIVIFIYLFFALAFSVTHFQHYP